MEDQVKIYMVAQRYRVFGKSAHVAVVFFFLFFSRTEVLVSQNIPQGDTSVSRQQLDRVFEIHPVTVFSSAIESSSTISSIDQGKIERLTEPTIEPLLNATPGLWMQTGALNTNRISIRGVGYREPFATTGIKIYLDEIPLTNGVGESSIEDIHPNILSGIDIWRGPSSALWGSGLGGMIHLKSHFPTENSWHTRIQTGSFDRFQLDQHLTYRYGKDKQWGTAFHYQYLNDGGFRENNHYQKNSLTWMQQWSDMKVLSIKSFVHAIGLKAFIPSSLNMEDYQTNPTMAAPTWAAVEGHEDYTKWITGLNFTVAPSSGWVYKGSLFGTFFSSDEVRPFNVLKEDNTALGMRHRFSFQVKEITDITAGLEYFKEQYAFSTYETLKGGAAGMQLSDESESRSYLNAFIQTEWTFGTDWSLFGGLSAAFSALSNEDVEAKTPIDLFPTLGVHYSIGSTLSISTSISRGYSSLALDDMLNANGMINSNIVPETGWSEEVSLKFDSRKGTFLKLTLFNMNIKNTVITRRILDDLFEKINGGSSVHQGIELEYKWITSPPWISIEGAYTYGNFRFDEFVDAGMDYKGNQLPGTPLNRVFTRMILSPFKKWDITLDYHFVSNVYLNDANTVTGRGYQLINAGMRYEFLAIEDWIGTISATAHNLFNISYSPMFQINAPGLKPRYYYPGKPAAFYLNMAFTYRI